MIVSHTVSVSYQLPPPKLRLALPSQKSMNEVIRAVSKAFNIPADDLRYNRSQYQYLCRARYAAWHIIRRQRRFSLQQIGQAFDFRDHSTIINGLRRAEYLLQHDPDFAARYEEARGP